MEKTVLLILTILALFSCNNSQENTIEVRKGNFYMNELDSLNSIILADTIRYSVTIKNPDPNDYWTEIDIRRMDEMAIANIIFNAIYNNRLTAYEFFDEKPMTIKQVKELEKKYPRTQIGRMQFSEEWYFDEDNLQFGKKINSIMLAYELKSSDGEVRYTPGVLVYLNKTGKKPEQ